MALLCVLLAHALVIALLIRSQTADQRSAGGEQFEPEPITLYLPPPSPEFDLPAVPADTAAPAARPAPQPATTPSTGPSAAITQTDRAQTDRAPTDRVDWPLEGKKAAARVLAREAEAERVARMFAGPGGTWASLTKRQRSKLNKFRFKEGIDGMEYDEKGNQILHISDGCMIVNSGFIACKIGKVKVRSDMFENMREYFDELRLPETNQGNGTEPEALRPAY